MRVAEVLSWIFGVAAACGIGYYAVCLWSAKNFLQYWREQAAGVSAEAASAPAVSVLKPLKGSDPQMLESFRSHCRQENYTGAVQIVFGMQDANDPAAEAVRQLRAEFPAMDIAVVIAPEVRGANRKVSSLVEMLKVAKHDHLIVNDSDIRVPGDYLRRVMGNFGDPRVGMVTCLYRGRVGGAGRGASLGSALESLGISTDFSAGVLAARQLEGGIHFGLGSTLAFSREALDKIGGFEPLLDYLADDFEIGARIAAAGYKCVLSDVVVDTFLPAYSMREFFDHQMRWARSTRDSRPWGYAGIGMTFGLPWAMLAAALARGAGWSLVLLLVATISRFVMAGYVAGKVVKDAEGLRRLWLVPLRDLAAVGVWVASFAGKTVKWRGERFALEKGRIKAIG